MIEATVHSDDHQRQETFDATPWFLIATDTELRELHDCGWGGDYPADTVVDYMDGRDHGVTRLFEYLHTHPGQGFECHVNPVSAQAWLSAHRPCLLLGVRA